MEKLSREQALCFKESHKCELKKSENKIPNSFWETYSAFANTEGGVIILGIDEKNSTDTIQGVNNHNQMTDDIWNTLSNPNKVSANLLVHNDIQYAEVDGKVLMFIEIREAPDDQKPIYLNGNIREVYIRKGTADKKSSPEEIRSMLISAVRKTQLLDNYSLDDLDENSVRDFKIEVQKRYPDEHFERMSTEDFLIRIGALRKDRKNNEYKLTADLLLFLGKYNSITDRFSGFHLDYFNRKGDNERWIDRVASDEINSVEMNIYNFYRIVYEKMQLSIKNDFALDENNIRKESKHLMLESIRESLANALVHADYFCDFPKVKVEQHEGWFYFENSGKMLVSIDEFLIGGKSVPRNAVLAKLARLIGMVERQGFGGVKIYRNALELKYRAPEIKTSLKETTLKIWNIDLLQSHSNLSEEEKTVFNILIKSQGLENRKDLQTKTGYSDYILRKTINNLLEKQLITIVGVSRSTKYGVRPGTGEFITQLQIMFKRLTDSK